MKHAKHTPGPWTFGTEFDYTIVRKNQDSGEQIIVSYEVSSECEQEDLANARLISAAPEMLDLIKALLNCDGAVETRDLLHREGWALLVKATGGAK
jgi:hypothetical protein